MTIDESKIDMLRRHIQICEGIKKLLMKQDQIDHILLSLEAMKFYLAHLEGLNED